MKPVVIILMSIRYASTINQKIDDAGLLYKVTFFIMDQISKRYREAENGGCTEVMDKVHIAIIDSATAKFR